MNIGILTGGENSEREISLLSAHAVKAGLEDLEGKDISWYDLPEDMPSLLTDLAKGALDFCFVMIHGKGGEDGQIAGILDFYHVGYQCTSPDVLALTINKRWTKCVWRSFDLPVADDHLIQVGDYSVQELHELIRGSLQYPCVWKELDEGSSNGVHILENKDDLTRVRSTYTSMKHRILLEEFLEGEEITIPVLERDGFPTPLPLIHIVPPAEGGFDYTNKYNGATQEIVPSGFPEKTLNVCSELALKAYYAVGCTKYARVDAILTSSGPVLLEINTIPGFTDQSLFPKSAKVAGYSFAELLDHMIPAPKRKSAFSSHNIT